MFSSEFGVGDSSYWPGTGHCFEVTWVLLMKLMQIVVSYAHSAVNLF